MTEQERQSLKALLVTTAYYYAQQIRDEVLQMMVDDLNDLPFDLIVSAIKESRRDPKITRLPLPAQIRNRIQPVVSDEDEAREAAARIISAVSQCGHSGGSGARSYIGEVGWEVVRRQGGWVSICESMSHQNKTHMQAQFRDLALSIIHRSRSGTLELPPALPQPSWDKLRAGEQLMITSSLFVNKPTVQEDRRAMFDRQIKNLSELKKMG